MQVLVVGAGVVGLAVARAAAIAGHEVVVAEAATAIGTGVSSRNSEVIHAGLYYSTGSKRAHHCPRGRRMLYDFCASHGVPHRKCGKLVVATNASELERLEAILKQARINGVEGVDIIEGAAAKRVEPDLACVAAMRSPETGIVDSHRYMLGAAGRCRGSRRRGRAQHPDRAPCAGQAGAGASTSAAPIRNRSRSMRWSIRQDSAPKSSARATEGLPVRAGAAARSGERQLFQLSPAGRRSRG
jgi:glycine/D-amino acid oxidase-like deaminating enzyme